MGPSRPATWDAVGPSGSNRGTQWVGGLGLVNMDGILDEISSARAKRRPHRLTEQVASFKLAQVKATYACKAICTTESVSMACDK